MVDTQIILLNAGQGKKTKTYGPKCLFKLSNKQTVLEYQVEQIQKFFPSMTINLVLGFEAKKILKHIQKDIVPKYNCSLCYHFNENFLETNNSESLAIALKRSPRNSLIIYGDLIFNGIDLILPKSTTFFTCDRNLPSEIGPMEDHQLQNLSWQAKDQFAQILYLNKQDITKFTQLVEGNEHKFIFEILQQYVDNGNECKIHKIKNVTFDIDCLNDIKLADKYFEYSNSKKKSDS